MSIGGGETRNKAVEEWTHFRVHAAAPSPAPTTPLRPACPPGAPRHAARARAKGGGGVGEGEQGEAAEAAPQESDEEALDAAEGSATAGGTLGPACFEKVPSTAIGYYIYELMKRLLRVASG